MYIHPYLHISLPPRTPRPGPSSPQLAVCKLTCHSYKHTYNQTPALSCKKKQQQPNHITLFFFIFISLPPPSSTTHSSCTFEITGPLPVTRAAHQASALTLHDCPPPPLGCAPAGLESLTPKSYLCMYICICIRPGVRGIPTHADRDVHRSLERQTLNLLVSSWKSFVASVRNVCHRPSHYTPASRSCSCVVHR